MKSKIVFNNLAHSYTDGSMIKYTSVSTLVGRYKKPYNSEYWSKYKAYEKIIGKDKFKVLKKGFRMEDPSLFDYLNNFVGAEELNSAIIDILKDWENERDKSIIKGNEYHSYKEMQAKHLGYCLNPYSGIECKTIESTKIYVKDNIEFREPHFESLMDLEDGFHPELILWNNKHKIAGQADKVFIETIDGIKYAEIDDYKTNKKIATSSIFGKMLDPLSHLDDCNYNHYRLQISTYAWLLEQENYVIRNTGFTHLNKKYIFPYMKEEVELMLGISKFDKI